MKTRRSAVACGLAILVLNSGTAPWLAAQSRRVDTARRAASRAAVSEELDASRSELRAFIERYAEDRQSLNRVYPNRLSSTRAARVKQFYSEFRDKLAAFAFDGLSADGRVDYVLFNNHLDYELQQLELEAKRLAEVEPLVPFAATIIELDELRRKMQAVDSRRAAEVLNDLKEQISETQRRVEAGLPATGRGGARGGGGERAAQEEKVEPIKVKKAVANRGLGAVGILRGTLRNWFNFYNEYDPIFTWWCDAPYKAADQAMNAYSNFLAERVLGLRLQQEARGGQPQGGGAAGQQRPGGGRPAVAARAGDTSDIIGDPIGHDALMAELAHEMIPYTPEELIAIGKKELAWCEEEMKKASRQLGYGDDWHKALEHVKNLHVEPGKQPELIRDLALEAEKYVEDNDLLTVPPLAKEDWGMLMMTPERQLVNPFFTGGANISVSYPTSGMSHEQKLMSMRGNNIHFARATVHHELIPGHHLQGFMTARYKPYRNVFSTPFWGEGWALYWELLLWDRGFAKTPENRIGMLFWRMHRCARIIFSLSFHLEKMTPQECIDFLVERVGHERENATAEVRRSFETSYAPLYQAAYLLGGLQIYSLQKELVGGGKMTNKQFHDAILREGRIPVEMLRAILTQQPPLREFKSTWKFYGPIPGN
jgi:uncharacterized protein (DUF885 family)